MRSDLLHPTFRKYPKRRGKGYPVATVAFYGPDESRASKVAVGIVREKGAEPEMRRWSTAAGDIRRDPSVGDDVARLLKQAGVVEVIMPDRIIGCPHEEGIDYPEGAVCPRCPFWAHRDRWSGDVIS
jgi:Fe-S oxidoreductase